MYIGIAFGGVVGAYVPVLFFKSNTFDVVGILCGAVGSIVGLVVALKINSISDY